MSVVTIEQVVEEQLKQLTSLRNARQLFAELNYEPAFYSLSKPATAAFEDLPDAPQVIAELGDFKIIYVRLPVQDRLPRGTERPVVEQLLSTSPYALFIFSDDDESHWDFVNVKLDPEKRSSRIHRRISIGPDERRTGQLRTAVERLARIAIPDDELARFEGAPLAIQELHDDAFDVEQVTRKYYQEYAAVFEYVEGQIKGIEDREQLRFFTQRLFNRLMFLAFIQKKGWLKLDGDTDYLNALWNRWQKSGEPGTFYNRRLKLLFFSALDNPNSRNLMHDNPALYAVLGDVHYLNGGLFEKQPDDYNDGIEVPDPAIKRILDDLFNSFNFTVTESTPLDVEVAVDPEMLGKVFEELVTGRHETGSYYTPKPIVSFMCREALKAYLATRLPDESADAIESLVDDQKAEALRDPEAVLEALKSVTACDPACGSGAYLLGMLHELLDIRRALFASRNVDPQSEYQRKLEIIQNNVYGVDIDPFATNIARLRLWLSLAVDYEGDQPEPLPNLDFKIETGDSLMVADVRPKEIVVETGDAASGYGKQRASSIGLRDALVEQYRKLKDVYLRTHEVDKERRREEILKVRRSIQDLAGRSTNHGDSIDWPVEFAEVFAAGGFDVVLSNPPYVRQELIKEIKPELKRVYGDLYAGKADLYVYFYYRTLEILKPGGLLALISSNKWFKADYGQKLREHVVRTTDVLSITDFGELPVFEAAATFPMIFIARKGRSGDQRTLFTEVASLAPPYPDMKAVTKQAGELLPKSALGPDRWLLTDEKTVNLILTMERDTIPLGKYVNGQIYNGVKTGFNTAFVIDGARRAELIAADPKSAEIIKPLAVGDDIRKWHIRDRDRWLIVTKIGVKIARYPAIFDHLSQWENQLKKRYDKGNHWWELRACAYYSEFEKPKVVYPVIAKESRFTLDLGGHMLNDKCFLISSSDLYLLAVLNSDVFWNYSKVNLSALGTVDHGGRLEFRKVHIEKFPIPVASDTDRREIAHLAERCIEIRRSTPGPTNIREFESAIDERVSWLYGI